ncbi:LPXTG-motif cell wall anchor domain protein [Peptoniphilus duerdenii ATCC BAA-1640]|uniref:LPXTG-motif cell wall anchor domain protein n=1 Tax=Peptoniphilus duerdenii ATCC BAA-1640 TaxID=862517 RepID=E0NIX5_9FIRM|nr:SpaA isopeptide-forming pilin-related protein [Peptoniphilus duerdenii]EFM26265.1 LPXTG-motif cell wall anchor domain protein [Peptoniphilus duerdenii ATCC BAA-1640]
MKSLSKRAISLILAVLMIMDVFAPVAVVASSNSPQNNVKVLDEEPDSETNSQNNEILIPATPQTNPEEDTLVPVQDPASKPSQNSSQKPAQNKTTPNQLYKSWTLVNPGKTTYSKGDILDLSKLSVRVTKTDGSVATFSYVQLLKDTNFDVIENVGNKINLQPGKGSVTLVGPNLNPITVNIVVNDSADQLQGANSNDELVPAIDPQANEENDELVVAENPNDKKTNIIEGNEQNSPEKEIDKQKKEEDDELKGNILDQVAGKETEGNQSGLPAFDPLKALGLNKEDRELTEEELEAGLTKVELPTLNEAPVSPVFARSAYQSTGLIGDENLKEDLGLDMSDEFAPQAVGAGNNEGPQNVLQLDGKKFNIRTNFQTKVANGPIRAGQYFKIKLDDKLTLKDQFSLQPLRHNGQVIATAKYNAADNTITYKLITDINEDISVPVNIPVDYNPQNITPDENGNFVVTNKVSGLGVINPKDFNPKKVNKFGNVTNQITEPGRKEVTEIIESGDKEHKVYLEEWSTPVIEDKNLVGFNWTFTVTSDTDLNSLGYRANFTTVKGSGLGEIKNVKINGQDAELTDQLENALGIVDSKHHALESEAQGITYTFYTEVTDKQSAYMVDFSLALTAQNKVGAKRCIADEGYNLDDIAVATTSRVGMNNRTTILGEFPIIDGAKWTVTDAVSTGDNNEILPLEQRTIGGDQVQTGTQIAVYKLNSDGQMVEDKAAEETIRATEAQETYQVADQPVGTIAAYIYDTAINKDENQPEAKKELTLGGVEIAINAEPLADDSWHMEESLDFSEEKDPQAVGAEKPVGASPLNLDNKKFTIRTRLDTSTITGPIQSGQFFEIKLDPRLIVKQGTTLPNIVNDGAVLATPEYIEGTNSIKYTVKNPIAKNLQIPLAIDVDYNTAKIQELDGNKNTHPINNSISGLGVVRPVKLPEVIVNNNGDVVNGITEPDGHQVLQIVEPGSDYKVYMDAHGTPVVKDGKLVAVKWSVTFTSTKDLLALGLSSNATTVKGSGLGELSNLLLNGKEITTGLSTNEIEGQFGIVASKNHTIKESTKEVRYTFETKITNPQEKYALDLSVALNNKKKTGAVRLIFDAKDNKSYMEDTTSKRAGINNRTTILGEFSSDTTARWTVTDQVSTGDKNNGLPIAKRELTGDQELTSAKMAVYGLNEADGKMVIKQSVDAQESKITSIPKKEANPSGQQLPGRIAVYEFNTDITDSEAGYSLSGVNISKYQPIKIKQTWSGIDGNGKMPEQKIEVKDANGNALAHPIAVSEGTKGQASREFDLPAVKKWEIIKEINPETQKEEIKEVKITPNIVQTFPKGPTIGGKTYSYKEKYNYYSLQDGAYHIYNVMTESTDEKDADFTIIKTDSKDPTKKLSGAKFTLQSPKETITLQTDASGKASFKNISPGTYTLIENEAPKGYKLDQTAKQITVSSDGKVSVEGNNISMQGGKVATVLARHNYYPSYPSYMNAMHYGSIDQNGNVEFYIYLKPEANRSDGSTNKDTRLDLNLAGGGKITSVEVIDVAPNSNYKNYNLRANVVTAMQNQTASSISGSDVQNKNVTNDITGKADVTDPFTGKTGYQVKFPTARFNNDWGFLVKVKATGGTNTSTVSYDWLTDNQSVANEAKIQETIGLSTKSSDPASTNPTNDGVTLNISNEEFEKADIEVTKVDENGIDGLSGATFTLKDADNNPIIDVHASNEEGKKGLASFGKQAPGKYIIEEKKAPQGYKRSNVIFEATVTDDGKVTYKAKFKDGNGTPINGVDYILEDVEIGQDQDKAQTTVVNQSMTLQEKQSQPDDGRIGWQEGIWEAYGIESYRYSGTYNIQNAVKGGKFKIQFDRNLDFKRYVYEIPDLKDGYGNLIAKPYFNYDTNLLTYVFEDNYSNVNASINIVGIIPDKYYATQTNKTNGYDFKIVVDPDASDASTTNKTLKFNVKTDYYAYDSQGGSGPLTSEYITDIYKGDDGNIYLRAVSYYNPTNMSSGQRTIRLDWLSMKKPRPGLEYYKADGYPAFGFEDLKVYKVYGDQARKQELMPLSYGIRPEQDTSNYSRVYSKSNVNPAMGFSESGGDVRVTYRPEYLKSHEGLMDYGHERHPLEIQVPRVSGKEGYVIVQTFKVTDEQRFKDLWSGYYLSNGSRHTGSYQKGNYNWALGSETGKEIPTFYSQKIKLINKKYKPGSFKINKTNEADNKPLADAIFELRDTDGTATIKRYSGADGIVEFNNLEPGIYTLEEIQAPKNFTKSNRRWQVAVYDDGNVVIREIGGSGAELSGKNTIIIPVTNKPIGEEFKVYKKKSDGTPLQGAKFKITKQVKEGEQGYTDEKVSDPKGVVNFDKSLTEGTYVIEETEAPTGYRKLDKEWVLVISKDKDGNLVKKVYNHRDPSSSTTTINSILEKNNVNWVNVRDRSLEGWNLYDNRRTDWTGNFPTPFKMGTRIVGINTSEKYVIQRYVLNPEANSIDSTNGTIHREKTEYQNMDWYKGNAVAGTDYQVFKLNKAVTGEISDIRLAEYGAVDITDSVKDSAKSVAGRYGEPNRLSLDFPATETPIVVDVKIQYTDSTGGVGTGMDWTENGVTYWKSDYYERVNIIKEAGPVLDQATGIQGAYISDNSLDVTNEEKTFGFKLKKVKEDNIGQAIKGAEFKLTGPKKSDGSKQEERFMTTGSDGMISFDKLKPGTYKLEETNAAPGYEIANKDWEVRITDKGKVFIKVVAKPTNTNNEEGTASRSAEPESVEANTKLSIVKDSSVAMVSSIEELNTNLYNNLSSSQLKRSLAETVLGKDSPENLEIGNEIVGAPVRAGGWEDVDPARSNSPTNYEERFNYSDNKQISQTKIISIDKTNHKFIQRFLINVNPDVTTKQVLKFHSYPGKSSLVKGDFSYLRVQAVGNGSTIDNIVGTPRNLKYSDASNNYNGGKIINMIIQNNGTITTPIVVEIEKSYTPGSLVGIGATIFPLGDGGTYPKNMKIGQTYNSDADINYKNLNQTYTITTSTTDNNGNLKVEVGGQVGKTKGIKAGEQVAIYPQPNDGYELADIKFNDISKYNPSYPSYHFTMPEGNVNIVATFKKIPSYNINIDPNIKNGKVTSVKKQAKENEAFTLEIEPDLGYKLQNIYVNNGWWNNYVQNGKLTLTMGRSDANVTATFERDPNKAIVSFDEWGGSGAMGPFEADLRYYNNFKLPQNEFKAPAGKIFRAWWYIDNYYDPGDTITVRGDSIVYATWKDKPVETVIVSFDKNGGTGNMADQPVEKGKAYVLPACGFTAPANKEFKAWEVNGTEYQPESSITVNANTTVKAIWKDKTFSINVVPNSDHGSITASASSAKTGDKVTITVNPDSRYELEKIEVQNRTGTPLATLYKDNPSFTMPDQDVYLKAFFKVKTSQTDEFNVYIEDNKPERSVKVEPSKAKAGERVEVSVTMENSSYALERIGVRNSSEQEVDFVKTGPRTGYFIMPGSDVKVYTTTKEVQSGSYEVKIADTKYGYVETDKVVAQPGDTVNLTPVANDGFKLGSYTVTNVETNESITITDNKFTMPNSAVTVSASFTSDGTSIPTDGEVEIPSGKFAQITNKQTGIELKIFKKSSDDSPLIGAVFELKKTNEDYTKDDETFTKVYAESDAEGNVRFFEDKEKKKPVRLKPGKYLLTETKSPAGYKKPAAPWRLEVKEKGGQLVITQNSPKYTATSFLSSDGVKAGDNTTSNDKIKYKSIIKNIDPINKTFVQRIYIDTRGCDGKVNVQITPTTKREERDTPSAPPKTISGGVKTAYRTTYKVTNPGANPHVDEILKDYDLRKTNVSVVNTARWRPFDWGFDEDQINLSNDGVYFIDIEGFYDDNIKDPGDIELKLDFYGGERIFAQRTYENGQLGWKYDSDIGVDKDGNQVKRDAAYQQGMEALYKYYESIYGADKAKTWFYSNPDNGKYDIWLRKGAIISGKDYDAGRIVLATDKENPNNPKNTTPIQTSKTKANISELYSSDVIKTVPQEGMTITNEDETYNITFSKHAKLKTDGSQEDFNKNRLEGAVFKLQKKEGSFWYDRDESYVASAFNGYFGFRRLEPGRYRLLEVTPPQGYKPIEGPLLEFTIKQIDTRSGKIINPNTKKEVNLVDLTIVDPNNEKEIALNTAKAKIKGDKTNTVYNFSDLVKTEKFDIETCLILSTVNDDKGNPKEIPLKEANYLDPETKKPMGRIISGAQGYISLEYKPGGYVAEYGNASSSGGALVDYVTSATAKNMGKILNETPGKGKVTIKKLDENGKALGETTDKEGKLIPGAKFEAIRTSGKKDKDGNPLAEAKYDGTVDKDGILVIDGLPIGNYELKEIENPSGHINTGQVWHFTVGGKDLDPYAGDIARTGQDLTSKISIEKSELKVVRPNADDEKATGYERNQVIRPHVGQSLEFDNEFKLDPSIEIKPGDYFVLKLSENMDLEGVRTDGASNLDLFADGVGTIAKADYNKEAGTITYTFTKYAEQYKLLNFENKLAAHISLAKVRNSDPNAQVGLSVGNSAKNHNINIKYVVDTIEESYDNATVSLASKITQYNTKTGEFVHYFYVNRDRQYNNKDQYFTYTPNVAVDDLQLTYYKLRYNSEYYINQSMPESFAVNESDSNLVRSGGTSPEDVAANKKVTYNIGNLGPKGSMIIKVTGRMKATGTEKQVLSYKGVSGLYSKYYYYYDYWGNYIGEHVSNYPIVYRWDAIYAFDNTNTASADLTISAINPSNKIQFKKVDPYGNVIKPALNEQGEVIKDTKGIVKDAAYFSLFKNGGTAKNPNTTWNPIGNAKAVDKDGLVAYEKLEKGYYKVVETTSPPGYIKPTEAVTYFKVDESGKIYRKITVSNTGSSVTTGDIWEEVDGTVPIEIVNNKPIEFEKIDADDNIKKLEGAVFEVEYKEKEDGTYETIKVKKTVNDKETEVPMTVTSGKNGKFKLEVTKDGYYALKETKAPKDYGKFPGYIKEFKLEKGKVQVLEKDPSKASLTKGAKGLITSQVLEVDKTKKTFKQRLIINPGHKFNMDPYGTQFYIRSVNDPFNKNVTINSVKTAVVKQNESIDSLTGQSYKEFDSTNNSGNILYKQNLIELYKIPYQNWSTNIDVTDALVIEVTGTFTDEKPANFKVEMISDQTTYDEITYTVDLNNFSAGKGAYVDAKTPIVVENKKAEYPSTGGMGTFIFTSIGMSLIGLAYLSYRRRRGLVFDE